MLDLHGLAGGENSERARLAFSDHSLGHIFDPDTGECRDSTLSVGDGKRVGGELG